MSFIEGVGDEVTAFAVILLVLILSAIITFLLNSTPFTESRHQIFQSVPSESSVNENQEETVNEERSENREETGAADSNDTTCSTSNHVEEVANNNGNEPVNIDNDEQITEDVMQSQIYMDINDCEVPPAPAAEEIIETEANSVDEAGRIHIRLKYLDDTERTVLSNPTVKVGDFKRTHFAEDFANNKIVRLIFSGQLLQDNSTLQSYGVANNCVIHVQILQAHIQQNSSSVSQNAELDLSHLLWPLLSVILGICWILYFKYPEFFNVMSLGILFLFTGSFIYFYSQVEHQ